MQRARLRWAPVGLVAIALPVVLALQPTAAEAGVEADAVWSVVAADRELTFDGGGTGRGQFSLHLRAPELGGGFSAEVHAALGVGYALPGYFEVPRDSPFLRVGWRPTRWRGAEGFFLTVYPVDSQRLHLGWEYPATWGSTIDADGSERAPAVELRLARERWYGFVAVRSAGLRHEFANTKRAWMGMTGAGLEPIPGLRFELAGATTGGFTTGGIKGARPPPPRTDALSGRVLYQRGEPIGPSVDLGSYAADPAYLQTHVLPEVYPGGLSTSVSLEGTHVASQSKAGSADALALQMRTRNGFWRAHLLGLIRSATLVSLGEMPDFGVDESDLSERATPRGGVLVRGGADYHFARLHLTPGFVLSARGSTTRAVSFSAKATLRWDWEKRFSALGEVGWVHDPNIPRVQGDALLSMRRMPYGSRGTIVNGALLVQARY